jgi:putative transposase
MQSAGVRISMDGRGRWMDNVFIERFWRSLIYECIYLPKHTGRSGDEAGGVMKTRTELIQAAGP